MNETRHALLIANSVFPKDSRFTELRCPGNDVDALARLLKSEQCNFEVSVLKDKAHYEILLAISETLWEGQKDDLYLFYFSGHGKLDNDGNLHLATNNTKIDHLTATAIRVKEMLNLPQEQSRANTILILDCCYAGAIENEFRNDPSDELKAISKSHGTFVLTASTANQLAQEKKGDQLSLFTKHLVSGLSGNAETNGEITMHSLYQYLEKNVPKEGKQIPMKFDIGARGPELVIATIDFSRLSPDKFSKRVRELIFVELFDDVPEDVQAEIRSLLRLSRNIFSPLQSRRYLLMETLVKSPTELNRFLADWKSINDQQKNVATLYDGAQLFITEERWQDSIDNLLELLQIDPEHRQAQTALSIAQEQLHLANLYEQGMRFYESGDFGNALPYFDQIQNIGTEYKDVHKLTKKSRIEIDRRKLNEQEKLEKERLLDLQNANTAFLQEQFELGKSYLHDEDWNGALTLFHDLRNQNAPFPEIATLIDDAKVFVEAIRTLEAQDIEGLARMRGNLENLRERYPESVEKYCRLVGEASSKYLHGLYTLARNHLRQGDFERALDSLLKIRNIDPVFKSVEISGLLNQISSVHNDGLEDGSLAESRLQAAEELYKTANLDIEMQRYSEAIDALERAIILLPEHPKLHNLIKTAQREQKFATIYADGKSRLEARDWEGALNSFLKINSERPYYKDVDILIRDAKNEGGTPLLESVKQKVAPITTFYESAWDVVGNVTEGKAPLLFIFPLIILVGYIFYSSKPTTDAPGLIRESRTPLPPTTYDPRADADLQRFLNNLNASPTPHRPKSTKRR